jgi:glutamate synthase (ferredoxin)
MEVLELEVARTTEPFVKQIFIGKSLRVNRTLILISKLYAARKIAEHTIYDSKFKLSFFYVPSLSTKIIIFKGLLKPEHINEYYLDLYEVRSLDTRLAL